METHNFYYFQGIHIVAITWRTEANSVFGFPRTLSECYRCRITVTSAWYSNMLQNELPPATHKIQRWRECARRCFVTQHFMLPI